jgi:hypothetical protein
VSPRNVRADGPPFSYSVPHVRDSEIDRFNLLLFSFLYCPSVPGKIIRRRYRISSDMFIVILWGVSCRPDATGALGFTSCQKCSAAIRMLSYVMAVDIFDEYLQMGESICLEFMCRFCRAVIAVFGQHYCREPTIEDTRRLLSINESRGFPSIIGSIDCMHWEWKNCLFGWQELQNSISPPRPKVSYARFPKSCLRTRV